MPSIIRSLPVPRHISLPHDGMPGTIVDFEASKRRARTNRSSGEFSIRSSKSSQESLISTVGSLDIQIESQPIVCYGPANESSGALLSGMLWLKVAPWELELESLKMSFRTVTTTKKPVVVHCPDCTTKTTDLHTWEFISGVRAVSHGQHSYPFSYLVPGRLPATTSSTLGSIKYQLFARGRTVQGDIIQFAREINVSRSILEGADRNSLRVFPPTNLSAALILPSVIYRGGSFPVEVRLDGVVNKPDMTKWRLRKAVWRIEEKAKVVSLACEAHAHKIGGAGKGVQYEDFKVLATDELRSGWKSDFDTGDGKVELAFTAGIPAGAMATDDVDNNTTGLTVSHELVLELIVAEEYIHRNPKITTISPTGNARVLRMHFSLKTTARAGMGISWEDECPPLYNDVPSSPPTYQTLVGTSNSVEDLSDI